MHLKEGEKYANIADHQKKNEKSANRGGRGRGGGVVKTRIRVTS